MISPSTLPGEGSCVYIWKRKEANEYSGYAATTKRYQLAERRSAA